MPPTKPWSEDTVRDIISDKKEMKGALLPMLHALQETFGYVDERALPLLAGALNVSRAEVLGVVSFYHDFRRTKPGHHVIKVCRAEACQSMGSKPLFDQIQKQLSINENGLSQDGQFTLETVFCLGNCALSPSILIDENIYGRVSDKTVSKLLDRIGGQANA